MKFKVFNKKTNEEWAASDVFEVDIVITSSGILKVINIDGYSTWLEPLDMNEWYIKLSQPKSSFVYDNK